ncbi:hypothetical protein [Streptomyces lydicus]|uniref:hypothetical protein n=1 Tax=Streptomyces lydicus TaxID=47763 RepID=UPI001F5047D9|nr:hypothetical protein [Streptomyces lydicus]
MTVTATSILAARVAETACVTGRFTLGDGQVLNSYFDEYRLAADPQLLHDVADAMATLLPEDAEALAGIELGGVRWSPPCRRRPDCRPRSCGGCPSATAPSGRSRAPGSRGAESSWSTTWSAPAGNYLP